MNRLRILVTDDEEGIRESLRLILSPDYDMEFADNGQDALARLTTGRFDLVLLDIKMPKLDGLEVMKQLKAKRLTTPVLILTAYQSIELAKEAVKLGAIDYLPKPFDRDHLVQSIRGILTKQER